MSKPTKTVRASKPVMTWMTPEDKRRVMQHIGDVPLAKWVRKTLLSAIPPETENQGSR